MKHSKRLSIILLAVALCVWGTIAYRIYASVDTRETSDSSALHSASGGVEHEANKYIYPGDTRDPFHYIPLVRKDTMTRRAKAEVVWTPPPFKLSGILGANRKKIAVLKAQNGSAYFLHEGDTLNGLKVLKIKEKAVTYRYHQMNGEWVLENF